MKVIEIRRRSYTLSTKDDKTRPQEINFVHFPYHKQLCFFKFCDHFNFTWIKILNAGKKKVGWGFQKKYKAQLDRIFGQSLICPTNPDTTVGILTM